MSYYLEDLWKDYNVSLMKFIKGKVQNEYDAEDLLQDIFLKLGKKADKLKDVSKPESYIYQIARNTIIDYYRKNKDITMEDQEIDYLPAVEKEHMNFNEEIAKCLRKMIITLPDKYQTPVELYDILGKKHKEIADRLSISISGSKTRVQRAREKLREKLLDCCDFEFDSMGNIIDYREKNQCRCEEKKYTC